MTRLHFIAIFVVSAFVNSSNADVVTLSERQFWLGETPSTLLPNGPTDRPFFGPDRIDWIEDIIDADPALNDTVTIVERFPRPGNTWTIGPRDNDILIDPTYLDPRFVLNDYDIYTPWNKERWPVRPSFPGAILYLPKDETLRFLVSCGVDVQDEQILGCSLFGKYPQDANIRLKARLYFPDFPANDPDKFLSVITRLRELVTCLDVTDEMVNVRLDRPTLSKCSLDLPS